jgi:hypothetical protein
VADEAAGGGAGGELPQAEGLVPRRGEGVGTVGGDDLRSSQRPVHLVASRGFHDSVWGPTYAVRDDMGVALERPLGVAVLGLVAREVPDNQGVVARGGEEHVGAR